MVDTNVAVAGLFTGSSGSPVVSVLDAMLSGALVYLMPPALLEEYLSVLLRPKLVALHGLAEAEVDQLLVELTANAVWREPTETDPAPDRGDDHLWSLLAARSGSVLITGDRLLLDDPPATYSVISPSTWVKSFAGADDPAA